MDCGCSTPGSENGMNASTLVSQPIEGLDDVGEKDKPEDYTKDLWL